jgi:hypothetical protein
MRLLVICLSRGLLCLDTDDLIYQSQQEKDRLRSAPVACAGLLIDKAGILWRRKGNDTHALC